jgi:hypothetical protein
MAMVYGALGRKDEAFAWLDKALREHDGIQLLAIKVNLDFDPLRSDPRFADVLRRRGLAQKILLIQAHHRARLFWAGLIHRYIVGSRAPTAERRMAC